MRLREANEKTDTGLMHMHNAHTRGMTNMHTLFVNNNYSDDISNETYRNEKK